MDREAWEATVHRVTKSWTQLKQLSTLVKVENRKRKEEELKQVRNIRGGSG